MPSMEAALPPFVMAEWLQNRNGGGHPGRDLVSTPIDSDICAECNPVGWDHHVQRAVTGILLTATAWVSKHYLNQANRPRDTATHVLALPTMPMISSSPP